MFVQSVYLLVNWEGTVKICALYPILFCFSRDSVFAGELAGFTSLTSDKEYT